MGRPDEREQQCVVSRHLWVARVESPSPSNRTLSILFNCGLAPTRPAAGPLPCIWASGSLCCWNIGNTRICSICYSERQVKLKCNSYLLLRSVSMTVFVFSYTARTPEPELDGRTVAHPSFRIDTVSTIFVSQRPALWGRIKRNSKVF